jgi:putative PEP-CTERM system histidine kinase
MPEWLVNDSDAWLIVPLVTRNHLTGLVMLRKSPRPQRLNYEDRDLLKTAGHQIAVHLAQESSDNLLAQSKQFEAYNRLTAFLMHDLNNLIAQQSMIVKNAERHKRSPEFVDDAMLTISSSVLRMRSIMDQLKQRDVNAKATKTVLKFIISAAVDRCAGKAPEPEMDLRGADLLIEIDAERFAMVLTHLIRNAQDATPPNGSVKISADCPGSDVCVRVADNGSGMTPDFVRDHLFRPFDSTKGSQGMGIGAYQAREFARGLGGDLKVSSSRGMGTTVVMSFPKSAVGAG